MIPGLFALIIVATVASGALPKIVIPIYLATSLAAFVAYALDKAAAQAGQWRIPNAALHLLSLFGGWPGAMLAQQVLRHKTRKTSFRFGFWVTVAINLALLAWVAAGNTPLHSRTFGIE